MQNTSKGNDPSSGLEIVAQHLQAEAENRSTSLDGDLFGRSAFNRYYYATYLVVRSGLAKLQSEWSGEMPHATIPEVLRGKILKVLKKGMSDAQKNDDSETIRLCSTGVTAASALASLMDKGRGTRVAADYNPEIPINFTYKQDFQLNTISVSEARSWPVKARAFIISIERAWRQIND